MHSDAGLAISVEGQKTLFNISENAVNVGKKEGRGGKAKGRVNKHYFTKYFPKGSVMQMWVKLKLIFILTCGWGWKWIFIHGAVFLSVIILVFIDFNLLLSRASGAFQSFPLPDCPFMHDLLLPFVLQRALRKEWINAALHMFSYLPPRNKYVQKLGNSSPRINHPVWQDFEAVAAF